MSLNKAQLIGNVGQDPKLSATKEGKEIASFSLATSESWKDKNTGEKQSKTEWHNMVVFSQGLVNVIKNYVKKGSKLYIEGKLHTRKWTDKNGIDKYTTEVVLQGFDSKLILLDSKDKEVPQQQMTIEQEVKHEDAFNKVEKVFEETPF